MPLDATQTLIIRRRIGDNKTDQDLSDTVLDAIYDDTTLGNSDMNRTTVWALRERWGMAINDTDISQQLGASDRYSQKPEQIKELLDYWEALTGMGSSEVVTISVTATNTYRADSRQTEEPDYSNGTLSTDEDCWP